MTDELTLPQALRKMADDGKISTHSENCWQWHLPCAAMLAADQLDDLQLIAMRAIDLVRTCKRDHSDEDFDHCWAALCIAVRSRDGGDADD